MATVTASGDETMARRRAAVDRLVLLASGVPELLPVLIHAAHQDGTWPLTLSEAQAAVDRLSAAGLLGMVAGRPALSAAGDALWRSMQRSKPARQRERIAQVVDDHPPGDTIGWVPTPDEWDGALDQFADWSRRKTEARLHIIDGLLRAIDHGVGIIELSQRSQDRMAVVAALLRPPFSFSEIQAQHVLDRTVAGFSQTARDKLLEEAAELRAPRTERPDPARCPERRDRTTVCIVGESCRNGTTGGSRSVEASDYRGTAAVPSFRARERRLPERPGQVVGRSSAQPVCDHRPVPTTCEVCGGRSDRMPADDGVLRCPHCMHTRPFVRPPLLAVIGPVGVGKSTMCSRLAGTLPGVVLLDADTFGEQHVEVVSADPDYAAFWRWLMEIAHEIAQNNLVVTYFSVMLPEQILANVEALRYFDSVHFLYLRAPDPLLRERITRQAGTIAIKVDIDAYLDERTKEWNAFNAVLDRAATSTPQTTVVDATRPPSEVEEDVRAWINAHVKPLSPFAT